MCFSKGVAIKINELYPNALLPVKKPKKKTSRGKKKSKKKGKGRKKVVVESPSYEEEDGSY